MAHILSVMLLVYLTEKINNKDTKLNPVSTKANDNLFLTFPRDRISLIITSLFYSCLAGKSGIPL